MQSMKKMLVGFFGLIGLNSSAQNFEYAVTLPTVGLLDSNLISVGVCVATHSDGSVVSAGYFSDTLDFDPGPGVLAFPADINGKTYIQKLDASGNLLWAKSLDYTNPYEIAVDASGNIYITGVFAGTVDFDPGPGVSIMAELHWSPYILKLSAAGNFLWSRQISNSAGSVATFFGLETSVGGNVIMSNYFMGTTDLDPTAGVYSVTAVGASDLYIVNLDSIGNYVWGKVITGSSTEYITSISQDAAGNIYCTGGFQGVMDADPGPGLFSMTSSGSSDAFIIKLNSSGIFQWAKQLMGPNMDFGKSIDVDAAGNAFILGWTNGNTDFDPGAATVTLSSPIPGLKNTFILKLDTFGNFKWVKQFGSTTLPDNTPCNIILDADNNIISSGRFGGDFDMDPSAGVDSTSGGGQYFQKLDSAGNYLWGGSIMVSSYDACINTTFNKFYSVGTHYGSYSDLDMSPISSYTPPTYMNNMFLLKMGLDSLCINYAVVVDSISNILCAMGYGYAAVHAVGGAIPYTYEWNTSPVSYGSPGNFFTPGFYTLEATDSNGCYSTKTFVIDGFNSGAADLVSTMVVPGVIRPGFTYNIHAYGFNDGCDTISGQFFFSHQNDVDVNSVSPTPDIIMGDTMIWNFSSLNFDDGKISAIINVAFNGLSVIGNYTHFKSWIEPADDTIPTNNAKDYTSQFLNAYDPNIKSVQPEGVCPQHYILNNQSMTYTVQFQNTGTADAINIYVLDTIDTDLDISSLNIIGSSHTMYTELLPGNVLKFNFDNIHLPDSASNEPASHGYFIYEINQQPSLVPGTMLENTAYIYFDFNEAVVTNTAFNTITNVLPSCTVGINDKLESNNNLMVYPNPANSTITISTEKTIAQKISLMDVYGRVVKTVQPNSSSTIMDLQNIESGIYFVNVINGNSKQTVKVVKQ